MIGSPAGAPAAPPGLVKEEFVFDIAPFPSCHASTIVESKNGLVAAWFGGTEERNPDVCIWLSRCDGGKWSSPTQVADGVQSGSKRFPCWNPVLFQPRSGPLMLFYKVGPNPSEWWGMLITSADAGATWSAPRRLPPHVIGPVKNKPVQLPDGAVLCGSSTEQNGWRVHFERTVDQGLTWELLEPAGDGAKFGAIQPSILFHGRDLLQAVGRTDAGRIFETWSRDGGNSWDALTLTELPNPNSGIDAVALKDGRQLLVYNHTTKGRSPLNVAVSTDGKA
jgi:predicted neuraminidase